MTTEGEQQEAVCGTCGHLETSHLGRGANYQRGMCYMRDCGCVSFTPAPVVPSDDVADEGYCTACEGSGVYEGHPDDPLTGTCIPCSGTGLDADARWLLVCAQCQALLGDGMTNLEVLSLRRQHMGANAGHIEVTARPFYDRRNRSTGAFNPAPPTPSQDAEDAADADMAAGRTHSVSSAQELVEWLHAPQDAESVRNDSDRQQRSLSQDAEGDWRATRVRGETGIARTTLWRYPIRKTWHQVEVPEAVESTIRAPYEELVEALEAALAEAHPHFHPFNCEVCRIKAQEIRPRKAALESLGGRS